MADPEGERLLPKILHHESRVDPLRVFAVYANNDSNNSEVNFVEATYKQISQATNYVSNWLQSTFEAGAKPRRRQAVTYIGALDLRYNIFFYAAAQCGYQVFLPSPRNPVEVNSALLEQLNCSRLVSTKETAPIAQALQQATPFPITAVSLPSLETLLAAPASEYVYDDNFSDVSSEPVLVLHSSGSTGPPKLVATTHGGIATWDVRKYAFVPGRENVDPTTALYFPGERFYDPFPPFHMGGFIMKVIVPLINLTIPIYGPLRPPSAALVSDIVRSQKPRALILPATIIEEMSHDSDGIALLKRIDVLLFGGGPLSPAVGDKLTHHTKLLQFFGSTETGQLRHLRHLPEDWEYLKPNPDVAFEFQPEGDGTSELVMFPGRDDPRTSYLHHNFPQIDEWRTKDLFLPHPTKPGLWKFHARKDDILVLSSGEKLNPIPIETTITSIEGVRGALVVGLRRPRAALLVELVEDSAPRRSSNPRDELWPMVEKANSRAPTHGRIAKPMIIFTTADKPFKRAGKGTVIRRQTEMLYSSEIDQLYASGDMMESRSSMAPVLLQRPQFKLDDIKTLVRSILAMVSIMPPDSGSENLLDLGLDSIKSIEVTAQLKASLRPHTRSAEELTWLSLEVLFRNPTIDQLSNVILDFLNDGIVPRKTSRKVEIDRLTGKFTSDMPHQAEKVRDSNPLTQNECSIAITGTTGYFGSYLLRQFSQDTTISRIYALNRSTQAAKRFEERKCPSEEYPTPVEFMLIDFTKPKLGLNEMQYAEIQKCNAIIHNAWQVNFNLPLKTFEDNLKSVRDFVDLSNSSQSPYRPRIVFISSIAATGGWAPKQTPRQTVPAGIVNDSEAPIDIGYGDSKYVAEHILDQAAKRFHIPVTVVRTGQIYPSSEPRDKDTWPTNDVMGILLRASKFLEALPSDVFDGMDGVPVNIAAQITQDIVTSNIRSNDNEMRVYNLVNPNALHWDRVLGTVQKWCGRTQQCQTMDMRQWLECLSGSSSQHPDRQSAILLWTMFELLSKRGPMHAYETENLLKVSERATRIPQADKQLMQMWLDRVSETMREFAS